MYSKFNVILKEYHIEEFYVFNNNSKLTFTSLAP